MPYRYKKIRLADGSTVDEHRLVWERVNGNIPDGMIIHHKNGDGRDNRLENLELLTRSQHHSRHPSMSEAFAAAGKSRAVISPEGMSWCYVCQQHLPVALFGKGTRYNGLREICNPCRKIKNWEHRRG